ncbi:MAG: cell division protein FtsL [Myxococcota bacterium]
MSLKGRFLALWTAAVLATAAAFVVHLALRFEAVRLGYEVGEAREKQRDLIEERRLLSIEAATLRQAARIEALARGKLDMEQPESDRIVPIEGAPPRRAAGRVR